MSRTGWLLLAGLVTLAGLIVAHAAATGFITTDIVELLAWAVRTAG